MELEYLGKLKMCFSGSVLFSSFGSANSSVTSVRHMMIQTAVAVIKSILPGRWLHKVLYIASRAFAGLLTQTRENPAQYPICKSYLR